jgi:hypothetical protein
VSITKDNLVGLSRLCEEFQFGVLAERLSHFRESDDLNEYGTQTDLEARKRLLALEERMQRRDCEILVLRTELSRHLRVLESASEVLLGRVARLEAEVSVLHPGSALPRSTVPTQQSPPPSIVPSASMAPAALTCPLTTPASGSVPQAVVPIASDPATTSPASAALPPSRWNSAIVSDFPKLFEHFEKKQFTLLWRGSRDGFGKGDFRRRCDGHPNTLTVILDTKGNIFGGFTPVVWESRQWQNRTNCSKADPSLKSFLFTLRNPHSLPARRFLLKAKKKDEAIYCDSDWVPCFWDIGVSDECNANSKSFTHRFGEKYTNHTGLDGKTFFTGSGSFQVKEIEVFEITD